MKKLLLSLAVAVVAAQAAWAGSAQMTISDTGMAQSKNYQVNLNNFNGTGVAVSKLSAQVIYSSANIPAATFTDGSASTGAITIANVNTVLAQAATNQITVPATSAILGTPATAQFTVISSTGLGRGASGQVVVFSTNGLTGQYLLINGAQPFAIRQGVEWAIGASSNVTAGNIAAAINAVSSLTGVVASTGTSTSLVNVIYTTATAMGSGTNSYSVASTSPTAVSTAAFSGAVNPAYVTVNGNVLTNGQQWFAAPTSSMTAVSLAAAVAAVGGVTANQSAAGAVVYASATVVGSAANANTLTTSVPTYITTTTWSGGTNPSLYGARIIFNGDVQPNGIMWTDASGTSTGTALSIAAFLNSYGVIAATAPTNSSVIYATATTANAAGNLFTLVTSTASGGVGALTVASPVFTGGRDPGTVTINGITLAQGKDFTWTASTTAAQAATNLASVINANTSLNSLITAQAIGSVVTSTGNFVGTSNNFAWSTNNAGLTLFNPSTLTGGTNAGYTINSATITVANEQFTQGLAVWYSTGSGVALSGLTYGTTYFVVTLPAVSTNSFALATSLANATAGLMVQLTSSRTLTTADNFTLTPVIWSQGTANGAWQVSNDGTNWTNYTTNSTGQAIVGNTFNAVFPSTSTAVDFGPVNYNYLRMSTTPPTSGAVVIKVNLNGSN